MALLVLPKRTRLSSAGCLVLLLTVKGEGTEGAKKSLSESVSDWMLNVIKNNQEIITF